MVEKLANIITKSKKIKFDLPINKCDSMDCRDESLPTLIIGYELAKSLIPHFNILKKEYKDENIRWTFLKTEKAVDFENDLKDFYKGIIRRLCDKVMYQFIPIVGMRYTLAKKMLKYIKSDEEKLVYNENNDFVYIYSKKYGRVFGFSLKTARYFGINTDKIVKRLKDNASNTFLTDFKNIPYNVKLLTGEKIDKYMVIYEYF